VRVRGKNKIIKDNFVVSVSVSVLEKKLKAGWFNNKSKEDICLK